MKAPIYIFLNFVNFYQNHRAMINSFSRVQLEDKDETQDKLKSVCKGALTNAQMGKTRNWNDSKNLNPGDIASPCGYMAKNFPLDTYNSIKFPSGVSFPIAQTGLIMSEEKEKYVQDFDVDQWVKVDSDQFINWMVRLGSPEILLNLQLLQALGQVRQRPPHRKVRNRDQQQYASFTQSSTPRQASTAKKMLCCPLPASLAAARCFRAFSASDSASSCCWSEASCSTSGSTLSRRTKNSLC